MWIMQLGADGIREAAICSVLNNQYLMKKMKQIKGIKVYYAEGVRRLEQCRYSWQPIFEDTGFTTDDLNKRIGDFGLEHWFTSHHPYVVPNPFTLEPTESVSKDDLDEYVSVFTELSRECYEEPELIRNAPHNLAVHDALMDEVVEFDQIAVTWRQMKKRVEAGTLKI